MITPKRVRKAEASSPPQSEEEKRAADALRRALLDDIAGQKEQIEARLAEELKPAVLLEADEAMAAEEGTPGPSVSTPGSSPLAQRGQAYAARLMTEALADSDSDMEIIELETAVDQTDVNWENPPGVKGDPTKGKPKAANQDGDEDSGGRVLRKPKPTSAATASFLRPINPKKSNTKLPKKKAARKSKKAGTSKAAGGDDNEDDAVEEASGDEEAEPSTEEDEDGQPKPKLASGQVVKAKIKRKTAAEAAAARAEEGLKKIKPAATITSNGYFERHRPAATLKLRDAPTDYTTPFQTFVHASALFATEDGATTLANLMAYHLFLIMSAKLAVAHPGLTLPQYVEELQNPRSKASVQNVLGLRGAPVPLLSRRPQAESAAPSVPAFLLRAGAQTVARTGASRRANAETAWARIKDDAAEELRNHYERDTRHTDAYTEIRAYCRGNKTELDQWERSIVHADGETPVEDLNGCAIAMRPRLKGNAKKADGSGVPVERRARNIDVANQLMAREFHDPRLNDEQKQRKKDFQERRLTEIGPVGMTAARDALDIGVNNAKFDRAYRAGESNMAIVAAWTEAGALVVQALATDSLRQWDLKGVLLSREKTFSMIADFHACITNKPVATSPWTAELFPMIKNLIVGLVKGGVQVSPLERILVDAPDSWIDRDKICAETRQALGIDPVTGRLRGLVLTNLASATRSVPLAVLPSPAAPHPSGLEPTILDRLFDNLPGLEWNTRTGELVDTAHG